MKSDQVFLLLVHSPVTRWAELPVDTVDEDMAEHARLIAALRAEGRLVACSPLAPPESGRVVRVRGGRTHVQREDAAAESVAGYYVVRCPDVASAAAIAARIPDARTSHVLVRPLLALNLDGAGGPQPGGETHPIPTVEEAS